MEYLKSKNRILLQCITFIVITAFLCENIAWAGNYRQFEFNPAQSKLAANSLFKLIERYSKDKSQRALLIKAIKAEALDGFLKDPETKEDVFKKGKFPKVPREIGKTLNGFFEVIGEPKIEGDTASLQVRLDGNNAAIYLFRNPSGIQINPDIGIKDEDDLAIAMARGYWFKIDSGYKWRFVRDVEGIFYRLSLIRWINLLPLYTSGWSHDNAPLSHAIELSQNRGLSLPVEYSDERIIDWLESHVDIRGLLEVTGEADYILDQANRYHTGFIQFTPDKNDPIYKEFETAVGRIEDVDIIESPLTPGVYVLRVKVPDNIVQSNDVGAYQRFMERKWLEVSQVIKLIVARHYDVLIPRRIGESRINGSPANFFRILSRAENAGRAVPIKELIEMSGVSEDTIERDMRIIRKAGLVIRENKDGHIIFRVVPEIAKLPEKITIAQKILDEEYQKGQIAYKTKIRSERERIVKRLIGALQIEKFIPPRDGGSRPGCRPGDESAFGMSPRRGATTAAAATGVNPWGSIKLARDLLSAVKASPEAGDLVKLLGDEPVLDAVEILVKHKSKVRVYPAFFAAQLKMTNPELLKEDVVAETLSCLRILNTTEKFKLNRDPFQLMQECYMENIPEGIDLDDEHARDAVEDLMSFGEYFALRNEIYYTRLSDYIQTLGFFTTPLEVSSLFHNATGLIGTIVDNPITGRSRKLPPMTQRPLPSYGEAMAHHAFAMWKNMRASGYLKEDEKFVVAETGAGIGFPLVDFWLFVCYMVYIEKNPEWVAFYKQLQYHVYELSATLWMKQFRNLFIDLQESFGNAFLYEFFYSDNKKVIWNLGDFLNPESQQVPEKKYKGFLFSSELLDDLPSDKLQISGQTAKTALVVPRLSISVIGKIMSIKGMDLEIDGIKEQDRLLREKYNLPYIEGEFYFNKEEYKRIIRLFYEHNDPEEVDDPFEYLEVYVNAEIDTRTREYLERKGPEIERAKIAGATRDYLYPKSDAFKKYLQRVTSMFDMVIVADYFKDSDDLLSPDIGSPIRPYSSKNLAVAPNIEYLYEKMTNLTADPDASDFRQLAAACGYEVAFDGPEAILLVSSNIDFKALRTANPFLKTNFRTALMSPKRLLILRNKDADPSVQLPLFGNIPGLYYELGRQMGSLDGKTGDDTEWAYLEDEFKPLGDIFRQLNKIYYDVRGSEISKDFVTTVSNDNTVARADALEFYNTLLKSDASCGLPETLNIYFWGIGNARHIVDFLDCFKELDKDGKYYHRLKCTLGDFSISVIKAAQDNEQLMKHKNILSFVQFDANEDLPFAKGSAMLIRFSELYDDLGNVDKIEKLGDDSFSRILGRLRIPKNSRFERKDGTIISAEEFVREYWAKGIDALKELDVSFLRKITWEENREGSLIDLDTYPYAHFITEWTAGILHGVFSMNLGAVRNLQQAVELLNLEKGGYLRLSDFGFISNESMRMEDTGSGKMMGQIWVGQPTARVNFPLLRYALQDRRDIDVSIEGEREYVSHVLGKEMRRWRDLDSILTFYEDDDLPLSIRNIIKLNLMYFKRNGWVEKNALIASILKHGYEAFIKSGSRDPERAVREVVDKLFAISMPEAEHIVYHLKVSPVSAAQVKDINTLEDFRMHEIQAGGLNDNPNRSCGTICESGHQELLDPQLEEFYNELASEGGITRDLKQEPLTGDEVIDLLEETHKLEELGITKEQLKEIIQYIRENTQILDNIQLLFAIPENNQKLWWISNPDWKEGSKEEKWLYAGGHFNGVGTRIHISLPLIVSILKEKNFDEAKKAALAIAKHDLMHIDLIKGRRAEITADDHEDEGMKIVRKIAEEERNSQQFMIKRHVLFWNQRLLARVNKFMRYYTQGESTTSELAAKSIVILLTVSYIKDFVGPKYLDLFWSSLRLRLPFNKGDIPEIIAEENFGKRIDKVMDILISREGLAMPDAGKASVKEEIVRLWGAYGFDKDIERKQREAFLDRYKTWYNSIGSSVDRKRRNLAAKFREMTGMKWPYEVKGVAINPTQQCNGNCRHCLNPYHVDIPEGRELSSKDMEDALSFAEENGAQYIVVSGGEPLSFRLDKVVEIVRKSKLPVFITTNGAFARDIETTEQFLTKIWDAARDKIGKELIQGRGEFNLTLQISFDQFHQHIIRDGGQLRHQIDIKNIANVIQVLAEKFPKINMAIFSSAEKERGYLADDGSIQDAWLSYLFREFERRRYVGTASAAWSPDSPLRRLSIWGEDGNTEARLFPSVLWVDLRSLSGGVSYRFVMQYNLTLPVGWAYLLDEDEFTYPYPIPDSFFEEVRKTGYDKFAPPLGLEVATDGNIYFDAALLNVWSVGNMHESNLSEIHDLMQADPLIGLLRTDIQLMIGIASEVKPEIKDEIRAEPYFCLMLLKLLADPALRLYITKRYLQILGTEGKIEAGILEKLGLNVEKDELMREYFTSSQDDNDAGATLEGNGLVQEMADQGRDDFVYQGRDVLVFDVGGTIHDKDEHWDNPNHIVRIKFEALLALGFTMALISNDDISNITEMIVKWIPAELRKNLIVFTNAGARKFTYDADGNQIEDVVHYKEHTLSEEDLRIVQAVAQEVLRELEERMKTDDFKRAYPEYDFLEKPTTIIRGEDGNGNAAQFVLKSLPCRDWKAIEPNIPEGADDERDRVLKEIKRRLPKRIRDRLQFQCGKPYYIGINRIGVDKKHAMGVLLNSLGKSKDRVLYFGDEVYEGGSDFSILETGVRVIAVNDRQSEVPEAAVKGGVGIAAVAKWLGRIEEYAKRNQSQTVLFTMLNGVLRDFMPMVNASLVAVVLKAYPNKDASFVERLYDVIQRSSGLSADEKLSEFNRLYPDDSVDGISALVAEANELKKALSKQVSITPAGQELLKLFQQDLAYTISVDRPADIEEVMKANPSLVEARNLLVRVLGHTGNFDYDKFSHIEEVIRSHPNIKNVYLVFDAASEISQARKIADILMKQGKRVHVIGMAYPMSSATAKEALKVALQQVGYSGSIDLDTLNFADQSLQSLTETLKSAGADIVLSGLSSDLSHIQGKGHLSDEGMGLVKDIASEEELIRRVENDRFIKSFLHSEYETFRVTLPEYLYTRVVEVKDVLSEVVFVDVVEEDNRFKGSICISTDDPGAIAAKLKGARIILPRSFFREKSINFDIRIICNDGEEIIFKMFDINLAKIEPVTPFSLFEQEKEFRGVFNSDYKWRFLRDVDDIFYRLSLIRWMNLLPLYTSGWSHDNAPLSHAIVFLGNTELRLPVECPDEEVIEWLKSHVDIRGLLEVTGEAPYILDQANRYHTGFIKFTPDKNDPIYKEFETAVGGIEDVDIIESPLTPGIYVLRVKVPDNIVQGNDVGVYQRFMERKWLEVSRVIKLIVARHYDVLIPRRIDRSQIKGSPADFFRIVTRPENLGRKVSITELTEETGISRDTIERDMRILRRAGLVIRENRDGNIAFRLVKEIAHSAERIKIAQEILDEEYQKGGIARKTKTGAERDRIVKRLELAARQKRITERFIDTVKMDVVQLNKKKIILAWDTDIGEGGRHMALLRELELANLGNIEFVTGTGESLPAVIEKRIGRLGEKGISKDNIEVVVVTKREKGAFNSSYRITKVDDTDLSDKEMYVPILELLTFVLKVNLEEDSESLRRELKAIYYEITGTELREAQIEQIRNGVFPIRLPPAEKIPPDFYNESVEILSAA